MLDKLLACAREFRLGARALMREKGLSATVVLTLALGIGVNAVMFSLVRAVLLRPLVNRDEDRLVYIRQSAEGEGSRNKGFSIPEIQDLQSSVKTLGPFGDFSVTGFTLVGLGQPRTVQSGVVSGSYFNVMGLRPVLGRLLDARDDGPNAAGAVVLTYRFWADSLKSDPGVLGKTVRLDSFVDARAATVVGVLEPCVPYPQDTEIIANVVTSAHHLSATMLTSRIHRMTHLFARLKPGVDLETARGELRGAYARMKRQHPEAYDAKADFEINADKFRDELTHDARTILLVLMATCVLVFVIACSNVANLILARSVRREAELGIRAALGASRGALRMTLLSESILLCAAGAALGLGIANPLLTVLARYMSRFSVRALDLTVDPSVLWVSAVLAIIAAPLLAFVPRLPQSGGQQAFSLASSGARVTGVANRKLRVFAVIQVATSFILIASATASLNALLSLETARRGFETQHVLSFDVPAMHWGRTPAQVADFYREARRRIRQLPGVQNVATGMSTPFRDKDEMGLQFSMDGHVPAPSEQHQDARFRVVSPAFFATLGLPIIEGRDFNDADRAGKEPVAIVSQTFVRRAFGNRDPLNHTVMWSDPILKAMPGMINETPARIVGVVPDMDDSELVPRPAMTIYRPGGQEPVLVGDHLFVYVRSDPYAVVTPITKLIHKLSADQPVEHAATLEDVRAEVLSNDRLNALVFSAFAAVALLIAVVGVAGVLAFSVSGRTREFGIRLAVGSQPRSLLMRVMSEGAAIGLVGLAVGVACGFVLTRLAGGFIADMKTPSVLPVAGSALILLVAAVTASLIPAARAARIDVIQALRVE